MNQIAFIASRELPAIVSPPLLRQQRFLVHVARTLRDLNLLYFSAGEKRVVGWVKGSGHLVARSWLACFLRLARKRGCVYPLDVRVKRGSALNSWTHVVVLLQR